MESIVESSNIIDLRATNPGPAVMLFVPLDAGSIPGCSCHLDGLQMIYILNYSGTKVRPILGEDRYSAIPLDVGVGKVAGLVEDGVGRVPVEFEVGGELLTVLMKKQDFQVIDGKSDDVVSFLKDSVVLTIV